MADRMSKTQYSPELFDLAQDMPGGLPLQLVAQWLDSAQTGEDAVRLLKDHQTRGFSVVSDSAGLTRLTSQRSLLEILALINRPKEVVHAYGTAIGGRGVGIWAADNTQMFYPETTDAGALLSTLLAVQDEIARRSKVLIGLGAHFGSFYDLSGGLYGVEADAIEEIAENDTEGGEIVVSQTVVDRLAPGHDFALDSKNDAGTALGALYRVVDGPRLADAPPSASPYPIPYSEEFYTDLIAYADRLDDPVLGRQLTDKHLRHKTVVLIERQVPRLPTHEQTLLEALALSAMMKDTGLRCLPPGGMEIKIAGPLGIYLFDEPAVAVRFGESFRQDLAARDILCRIGVDVGPVLVNELSGGGRDIAGMPVNIASKMAQDVGKPGRLYLSEAMREHVDLAGFTQIRYTVSGIQMAAFEG